MTFVRLLVEDEFTEDDEIIYTDLDFIQALADGLDATRRGLQTQEKPVSVRDHVVYTSGMDRSHSKKMAICSLQTFVAVNWIGCDYAEQLLHVTDAFKSFFPDAESYLELTDESLPGVKHTELLAFAKFILFKEEAASIWKARYLLIHQVVLSVPSTRLYLELKRVHRQFEAFLTEESSSRRRQLLQMLVGIELAQFFLWYTDVGSSKPLVDSVRQFSGLTVSFSGAMGKRTRFQSKETAQLRVCIQRQDCVVDSSDQPAEAGTAASERLQHPKNVALNDDTLLDQVDFSDGPVTGDTALAPAEQLLLFATACQLRRQSSFSPDGGEELMALVEYLISSCSIWCLRYECLLMRSLAEKRVVRRADRAVLQLQQLLDDAVHQPHSHTVVMQHVYCVNLTPRCCVQKQLADVLFHTGCIRSALDVYAEVHAWQEMLACYLSLQRRDKAEEVVRSRMQLHGESAHLLCLLGDATQDSAHYAKAWLTSGQKYFRAQTALGDYFFQRKDYQAAIPHYQSSLQLNSLQIGTWQRLAFAALTAADYALAVRAYRRFVEFEADVFEAWNNLAKAYLRLGRKTSAYCTLREAIKCNYEEWRLWHNFLIVSTDVRDFQTAIRCWHRLIDLNGQHADDDLIRLLVHAVTQDVADMSGSPASRLADKLLALFARIRGTAYSSPQLWLAHAKLLHHLQKETSAVLDAVRRCNRCIAQSGWQKDEKGVREGLQVLCESTDLLAHSLTPDSGISDSDRQAVVASKLMIESLMKSAVKSIDNWDQTKCDVKQLNELLHELDAKLQSLPV